MKQQIGAIRGILLLETFTPFLPLINTVAGLNERVNNINHRSVEFSGGTITGDRKIPLPLPLYKIDREPRKEFMKVSVDFFYENVCCYQHFNPRLVNCGGKDAAIKEFQEKVEKHTSINKKSEG